MTKTMDLPSNGVVNFSAERLGLWKNSRSHTYELKGQLPSLSPVRLANHGTVFPSNIHEQDICSPCAPTFVGGNYRFIDAVYFLLKYNCSFLPFERYKSAMFLVASLRITVMHQLGRLRYAFCYVEPYVSFTLPFFLHLLVPWRICCKNNKFLKFVSENLAQLN